MARIRSVHPTLFTDEAFVCVSMAARVLLIGVWTQADDQGVFEWKPVALKMRLFPVDALDVGALLLELEENNIICRFSQDGRSFGAIRNFCRYQRPKSPKFLQLKSRDIRRYVCSKYPNGEITESEVVPFPQNGEIGFDEPDPIPQNGETPPQREEGGDNRRKEPQREYVSLREVVVEDTGDVVEFGGGRR